MISRGESITPGKYLARLVPRLTSTVGQGGKSRVSREASKRWSDQKTKRNKGICKKSEACSGVLKKAGTVRSQIRKESPIAPKGGIYTKTPAGNPRPGKDFPRGKFSQPHVHTGMSIPARHQSSEFRIRYDAFSLATEFCISVFCDSFHYGLTVESAHRARAASGKGLINTRRTPRSRSSATISFRR